MSHQRDILRELVEALAERGEREEDRLKEELKDYLNSKAHAYREVAGEEVGEDVSRRGRYLTAHVLRLCLEKRYADAWGEFKKLEDYLKSRGWMELLDGNLYRLGAVIAGRAGQEEEAGRLQAEYEKYRAVYRESFGARVVGAMVGLWENPEALEAFEQTLAEVFPEEEEEAERALEEMVERIAAWGRGEAGWSRAAAAGALAEPRCVWDRVRALLPKGVAASDVISVPAGVGAFAEVPRERLRVDVAPGGGRLKVTVWETDEGDVRVEVQTPEAKDDGRIVRVVVLGREGEALQADVPLQAFEFEGRSYGAFGGTVLGLLGELRDWLGGEWAVVAAFVEEGTEHVR